MVCQPTKFSLHFVCYVKCSEIKQEELTNSFSNYPSIQPSALEVLTPLSAV